MNLYWALKGKVTLVYGGGCQNYGPFLGPLIRPRISPRIIIGTQKETIILTIPHIGTV